MNRRFRRPSKPVIFALLMLLSAALALLAPWASCLRGPVAPLGWVQAGLSHLTRGAFQAARKLDDGDAGLDARALQDENDRLRRQVQHEQLANEDLTRRLAEVTGVRSQLADEHAKILIAGIIAYDAAPRRATLTIDKGEEHGVKPDQWVTAGAGVNAKDPASGRELVIRQWLIGRVAEVWPKTSRILLASDPGFRDVRVRAAKILEDGRLQPVDQDCLLSGVGGGRMLIDRVIKNYYADDCRFVIVPAGAGLPGPLLIGELVGSQSLADAPLYYNLDVEPCGDVRALGYVYVIIPG
jgi:cell shape-determining protein MreC